MTAPVPPTTYAQWSAWFDELEAGSFDDALLERAEAGTMSWLGGVAELLAGRMMQAMSSRLDAIGKSLERRLQSAPGETELLSAMVNARREFARLRRFAALRCVPALLCASMNELIDHHAQARQRALEKSAASDRSGRLSHLVRRNRLDAPAGAPALTTAESVSSPAGAAQSAPRRILIS